MTFFELQARAHQRTGVLVLLFLLGVLGVVLVLDAVAAVVYAWAVTPRGGSLLTSLVGVPREIFLWVSVLTVMVIVTRSLVGIYQVRSGGNAVAVLCGGIPVHRRTRDPNERRLLNVVDEMAIASGMTVPSVYVLPRESAINAFAAGYTPNQSAIAVTRGALEALNRDELQGVIAHEFSHVLNGDARLNIRMIGVLGGLLFFGAFGAFLMRMAIEASA